MEGYRDSLHKAQQFPGEYKIKVNPPLWASMKYPSCTKADRPARLFETKKHTKDPCQNQEKAFMGEL